jgi:sterol desaturase/sphingolipid hydroxylase (fatty acid hydroxylase superfamily)
MSAIASDPHVAPPATFAPGAEYRVYGRAKTGGVYNSHLVSGVVFAALGAIGAISIWLVLWIEVCLLAAFVLDRRSWTRKVSLTAIPGQLMLYSQVLVQVLRDAALVYALAFALYVCVAPTLNPWNVAISSFVMLYGFYMVLRLYWLARYLWVLSFRWEDAGRTFQVREANLKSRAMAINHVLWAFFLGNVGLVVRCASQVVTIALFEFLRQRLNLDLTGHAALSPHLTTIFWGAAAVWLITLWPAIQPALWVYYRAHRAFHHCRPLYDSIHSIHHRAVLPTPLDSGTISPLEFGITEMAAPTVTLLPNWYWTIVQVIIALAGHVPSHNAGTFSKLAQHHLLHHRYFTANYGLFPRQDRRYSTLVLAEDMDRSHHEEFARPNKSR